MKQGQQLFLRFGAVALSGSILPLCFPPFGYWPFLLLVFPLLLLALRNTTPRYAFYLGMLHGMIGYGVALNWFFHIFGTAAVPLFAIMALFTALFGVLLNFVASRTRSTILYVFAAAILWTAVEFYRSELFFLRFPWITPGSALGPTRLSPITGVYGMSFLVVAASAALLHRKTIVTAVGLSLCILCLGFFRPHPVPPDQDRSITVTIVQSEDSSLQSYVALTQEARNESPDLIVWPEYALPYDVRRNETDLAVLTNLCAEMEAVLVVGTKTVVGPGDREWHNTALVLDHSCVLGEYYKARPVHFFNDGTPGHNFAPIKTALGSFATPICFDCDYSEVARRMTFLGAEFFAVPSFDAKSWSAKQHFQHALLFQLRAAENGRWLACAASSGVSQVIDPHGNVSAALPIMAPGTLTHRIDRRQNKTFFTHSGWLFPWLALLSSVVLLLYAVVLHIGAGHSRLTPRERGL